MFWDLLLAGIGWLVGLHTLSLVYLVSWQGGILGLDGVILWIHTFNNINMVGEENGKFIPFKFALKDK